MTSTLVSVVVPVHDGERYLAESLESVRAQDHRPLELIVVDDGSADRSGEIAEESTGEFTEELIGSRVIRQENQGVSAARNTGAANASGELVAFLDADDLFVPEKLSVHVAYHQAHPEIGFTVAGMRAFLTEGTERPPWLRKEDLEQDRVGFLPGNMVVRREVFERVGGFDPGFRTGEGAEWFARAKDHGVSMAVLPEVLLLRRVHDANRTHELEALRSGVLKALKASIDRQRRGSRAAERPLVSVVIPAYNAERYLREALESVLSQDYEPLEIVLVDDGSTDGTARIARGFGSRVRCVFQENAGTARARNRGAEIARGRFLAHLDADDVWPPGRLKAQMSVFEADPTADCVSGHVRHFYSPDLPEESRRRVRIPDAPVPASVIPALVMKREAFDRVGPFETELAVGSDLSWYVRAREAGLRIVTVPEVVLDRRIQERNKGRAVRGGQLERARILKAALDRRRRDG